MRGLSAGELLELWEGGEGASPIEQALLLLAAAEPGIPLEALMALPVGERDARLFQLRQRTFGTELEGVASCPGCGDRMELSLSVPELLGATAGTTPDRIEVGGIELQFRLPTSADLAAATGLNPASARTTLLTRCVIASDGAADWSAEQLPAEAIVAVTEAMARADPLADLELSLACPACGTSFLAPFDIVGYFWLEIGAWARRTLRDVHALASAYGWSEREILALSPLRRSSYLEFVDG